MTLPSVKSDWLMLPVSLSISAALRALASLKPLNPAKSWPSPDCVSFSRSDPARSTNEILPNRESGCHRPRPYLVPRFLYVYCVGLNKRFSGAGPGDGCTAARAAAAAAAAHLAVLV